MGILYENELIKGLRPYSEGPNELMELSPAVRSSLSLLHIYISGSGGVRRNGWLKRTYKIVEDYHSNFFEGDLRKDENLIGTLSAACGVIDWTDEKLRKVSSGIIALRATSKNPALREYFMT